MGFRFPIALNPFKTRTPTTGLGRLGKSLNPLNPVNAATMLLEEAVSGIVGSTLGPEARQRVEYFGYGGLLPGIALNVLDAGAVNAGHDQMLKEAQATYMQEQRRKRAAQTRAAELEAPQQTRQPASSPSTQRPVEEARPPITSEVPASPTPSMNELAQLYARQRILGTEMAKGGELQRRLYEGGAAEGMPVEDFMSWVETHPDLAYRLAEKRGLLPQSY